MQTSTLDRRVRPPSSRPPRFRPTRRRSRVLVATSALLVVAVGAGVAAGVATRQATASAQRSAAAAPVAPAGPSGQLVGPAPVAPRQVPRTDQPKADQPASAGTTGGAARPAVLADGSYDAFIRGLDPVRRTVVVDLVLVFRDDAAPKAAVEDGRSPEDARYLSIWVRNRNSRLRTLALARDLRVQLWGGCENRATGPMLAQLATDARQHRYYVSLAVRGGAVNRIEEHQIQPAC